MTDAIGRTRSLRLAPNATSLREEPKVWPRHLAKPARQRAQFGSDVSVADREQIKLGQRRPDGRNGYQSKQYESLVPVGIRFRR
jgi:hypothetical protein